MSVARVLGAGLALALMPCALAAQELRYTGSASYAQGDYIFTQRTHSLSLLSGLHLRWGRFAANASLPIIAQNSSAVTYIHGVLVPTGGPEGEAVRNRQPGQPVPMRQRRTGSGGGNGRASFSLQETVVDTVSEPGDLEVRIGDPVVSASIEALRGDGLFRSLDLTVSVKAPVADIDDGIGTGEWDYGVGASLAFGGARTLVFADAGWWSLGDMPELELRDYFEFGLGVGRLLDTRWSMLAAVSAATKIIDSMDAPASVSVAIARRGSGSRSINAGVSAGLTESSSAFGVFVGWGIGIFE